MSAVATDTDLVAPAIDYKQPNYAAVIARRARKIQRLRSEPDLLKAAKLYYRTHPWDFISDWGMTFDPRNPERGLPAMIPFVLFERQVQFVKWLMAMWRSGERGLVEKSRDMGVT